MDHHIDTDRAFTTGQALRTGLTHRHLGGGMLERPFHGLQAVRRVPPVDTQAIGPGEFQRVTILEAAERFSTYMSADEFYSHTTAAILWAIPLPLLADDRIHVSVRAPDRAPRGRGVLGHQLAGRGVEIVEHPEVQVRVTSAVSTWALLGQMLQHPYDLVAAADAILRIDRVGGPHGRVKRPPLGTADELAAAIPFRRKGALALREALPRARSGVASRPETWLRLTLVDAGLPEPQTDVDVYDDRGNYIGTVDLADRVRKIAYEYEGDHHRTSRKQWERDIEKHRTLAEAGWHVIRVTAHMLFDEPSRLVAIARDAIADSIPGARAPRRSG